MKKGKAGIFTLSSTSLIVSEALMGIIVLFLDTFLVSRILKLTPGDYTGVAIFNLLYYLFQGVMFAVISPLLRKMKSGLFVGSGALMLTMLFVVVYFLGDEIVNWIWILGTVAGIGQGLFNVGFTHLICESISSKHQTIYFSVKNIVIFLTKTIFPLVLGSVVDFGSFPLMCLILAVVCGLIFLFTFLVKTEKKVERSFNPIKFLTIVKNGGEETKPLKTLYLSGFFRGLSFDIIGTIFTVMMFLNLGAASDDVNYKIGLFKTIFTALQMVSMFIFLKFYHKSRAKGFLFISLALIVASVVPYLFEGTIVTTLIVFGTYNIFRIFITTITDMRSASIIRLLSMHSHMIEHNCIYNVIYRFFSGVSYLLFLLWFVVPERTMIIIILAISFVAFVGYTITLYKLELQLIDQDKRWKASHPDFQQLQVNTNRKLKGKPLA